MPRNGSPSPCPKRRVSHMHTCAWMTVDASAGWVTSESVGWTCCFDGTETDQRRISLLMKTVDLYLAKQRTVNWSRSPRLHEKCVWLAEITLVLQDRKDGQAHFSGFVALPYPRLTRFFRPSSSIRSRGRSSDVSRQPKSLRLYAAGTENDLMEVYREFGLHRMTPSNLVPENTCEDELFAHDHLYNSSLKNYKHPAG